MAPRAACRLERLGFADVRDYVLGIADWRAAGLPLEGDGRGRAVVGDATRPDIPTCDVAETLGAIRRRAEEAGWDQGVVLDCGGVVVGRLRGEVWQQDDAVPVEQVMEPGPGTVRPDQPLRPLAETMDDRGIPVVLVTRPEGTLIGAVTLDDARRVLDGDGAAREWRECVGCPGRWAHVR